LSFGCHIQGISLVFFFKERERGGGGGDGAKIHAKDGIVDVLIGHTHARVLINFQLILVVAGPGQQMLQISAHSFV
jgi:hypothetical protein